MIKTSWFVLFISFCVTQGHGQSAPPLERLNIDTDGISTSGISSGGCMATQFHVAYSQSVMGVGVFAGAAYYCAQGSSIRATTDCMSTPEDVSVSELRAQAELYASNGDIDSTANLNSDKIYVFAGSLDSVVDPGEAPLVVDFYAPYTGEAVLVDTISAEHTFPTVDNGNMCDSRASPFIGRCGYDGAYEALNHIYGGDLVKPDRSKPLNQMGTLKEFDQSEFFYISPPSSSSMDRTGYVYIPTACEAGELCKLHIALHGCEQQREEIGDVFATMAGYNEVGELNNIVILYPQTVASALLGNLFGCWDWWGYTINKYATKGANQPLAIARMVDKLTGMSIAPSLEEYGR